MSGRWSPPAEAIGPARADLEAAAALYRDSLTGGTLRVVDLSGFDRLGMSFALASFIGDDGYVQDGFGYGPTLEEATVGALGEIAETVHVNRELKSVKGVPGASYAAMVEWAGVDAVLDPRSLCLPAGSPWTPETPLHWAPVRRWPDGMAGWAPMETLGISPGDWRAPAPVEGAPSSPGEPMMLFRPITCGLGAGTSVEMALAHGVLELLQRDGNCTSFRAMDRGWDVDLEGLADPGLTALRSHLETKGLRLRVKLASTELGLTNVYAIGDPIDGTPAPAFPLQVTACGEAAHPNAERAIRKAAYEFVGARCRKAFMHGPLPPIREVMPEGYFEDYEAALDLAAEEPRALDEMVAWLAMDAPDLRALLADSVFSSHRTIPLDALPSVPDEAVRGAEDRLAWMAGLLGGAGHPIWWLDASPGEGGPIVTKTVCPGLEGETMSYGRIGPRGVRRLMERDPAMAGIGKGPGTALPVLMRPEEEAALGGPAWFDPVRAEAVVGRAYPLYREPSSHAAQFVLR